MLPREFIEERLGRRGATGLHVLETLADRVDRLLIVLALPFEVVGQDIVESIGGAFPASPRKLLELSQPLRLHRQRLHTLKVEIRGLAVNVATPAAVLPSPYA